MTGISHHLILVTGQDQEETQSIANPTDAHNHNLRADTIPVNRPHSTISHLKLNKEVEHHQESDPLIKEHTPTINLYTNKTEHRQVTHADTTTNSDNATKGGAEKKNREMTNCTKKKVVEEQSIRKKKRKENATKNDDAKCNDEPTVSSADNEQILTEDHQHQKCRKTYHLKFQNRI
jgi:hypothetical protein